MSEGSLPLYQVKFIEIVLCISDFMPTKKQHLPLKTGDVIYVLSKLESGWCDGIIVDQPTRATICQRGWFPYNHVKPLKEKRHACPMQGGGVYQFYSRANSIMRNNTSTPTLRRDGSGTKALGTIDSSASPAVNLVRVPSLTPNDTHASPQISASSSPSSYQSHIKQDYRLDMKYKPLHTPVRSSPTGTNTRSSSKSVFAEMVPVDPLQRLTLEEESALHSTRSKPATAAVGNEKIQVMSVAEVEMLLNSLGSFRCIPIWSPVSTDDGEIVFYNKDYNIYCRTLPLLQTPELNYSSVLPNDDHLIDLKPRKLDSSKTAFSEAVISNASVGTQAQWPRIGTLPVVYSRKALSQEGTPVEGQSPRRGAKKYSTDGDALWQTHSSVYLSKDEFFFHHQTDIRSWTELRDSILYQAGLSHDYLIRNNQAKFHRLIGQVSTYLSMYLISCRILRSQLEKGHLCKEVRKTLKRLIALLSRILLNATVYFSSNARFLHCSMNGSGHSAFETNIGHRDNKASCSSQNTTLMPIDHNQYDSAFDVPTFTPNDLSSISLRNLGSRTTEPALRQNPSSGALSMQLGASPPLRHIETVHELPSQAANRPFSASTTASNNILEDRDHNTSEDGSRATIDATLYAIERAFAKFRYEVFKLHKLVRSDDVLTDILPQVYPRLFKNSYDGGAWVNPFAQNPVLSQGSSLDALAGEANAENSSMATGSVSGVHASTLNVRQLSNTSTKTSNSTFNKNRDRTFSRSKVVRKMRYPLNGDTIKLFKSKLTLLVEKHERSEYYVLNQAKSRNRDLELAATTYETIALLSSLIDIMEALDLTFFINLRNLPNSESMANLDKESIDLRDHCVATVTALLLEFFDVKQASHDIGIGIIVDTQHLTLRDPYVFSSMRGDLSDDKEDDQNRYQYIKHEKLANVLCRHLIKQDVEYNDMNFLDTDYVVLDSMNKLLQIMELSVHVIEQLVSERENILHYAARLMKNDLIAELIKGEQEQWFEEDVGAESKRSSYTIPVFINTSHITRDADIPWYLDNQYKYLMVYDSEGNIKGGTKEALIEHLTNHLAIDTSFNITILITFRSMFTTTEFLNLLIDRYNLYPPEGLSYEEYNIWVEKKHIPIKVRVVNILKSWFKYYWSPAYYVPDLEELLSFAQLISEEQIIGAEGLFELVSEAIAHKNNVDGFVPRRVPFTIESNILESMAPSPSPPLLHASSLTSVSSSASLSNAFRLKKLKLLDIEPSVFAKQLTIKENMLYCKIRLFECLDRTWRTRYCNFGGSANISNFIRNSNHLTNFVSFMIVKQADLKRRIQIIRYFIGVAEHCRKLNNFSSMTAIVSAMFSSSVYRLKRTWNVVPESYKETLEKLNTLMDSTRNFSRYREQLESIGDVPCVPFFGVYLSDLTFTAGGNPDFLNGTNDVINVGKRFRIVNVLKEIDSYQRFSYKLKRLSDVQGFIDEQLANVQTIEKQYEQSLRIEPRSEDSTGLKPSGPRYHEKQGSMPWKGKKLRFVTRMKRSTGSTT